MKTNSPRPLASRPHAITEQPRRTSLPPVLIAALAGLSLVAAIAATPRAAAGEVSWSVSVGSDGHRSANVYYTSDDYRHGRHSRKGGTYHGDGHYSNAGYHDRGHYSRGGYSGDYSGGYSGGGGYYQSVWRPAVYATRYDGWGRAYRVCIRAGYYDKVWVATPRQTYYRSNHDRGYGDGWGRRGNSRGGWYSPSRGCY